MKKQTYLILCILMAFFISQYALSQTESLLWNEDYKNNCSQIRRVDNISGKGNSFDMPPAINIYPPNASAYDEITLTFDAKIACNDGISLEGNSFVMMHSGVTINGAVWQNIVEFNSSGYNGQTPILLNNGDSTFSITFIPYEFYGVTSGETVEMINAVFNNNSWDVIGKDFNPSGGCGDFYIPLNQILPPVADFTANNTTLYANGGYIDFTDLSLNNPTTWNWTFEGGNPSSSTLQNPTVYYNLPGKYDVTLVVTNADGSRTLTRNDFINVLATTVIWSENFEGDWTQNWYSTAGTWEVGIPTSGPNAAYTGQKCAATVLAGNYGEPVDSRLIRITSFTVPAIAENPRIRFWHWYNFSTGDWGKVQVSTDNGINWNTVSPTYINTGSNTWSCPSIDLSDYAGQTVKLAFYFHSQQIDYWDPDVSTGWYIDDITIVTGTPLLNNPETWEVGIGDWSVDKGTWEIGVPTSGPMSVHGGSKCAGTKLAGNYDEWVDSRLISAAYSVPASNQYPRLRFWHWYSFSNGDYGKVQIKTVENTTWTDVSEQYFNTGSGTWSSPYIDLSSYAGQSIQIAFYFHSQQIDYWDPDVSTGWYIDDITIVTGTPILNNPETWEAGIGNWSVDRGTWEVGTPTSGPNNSHGGVKCAGTVLNGNYHEWVDSKLISPRFTLPDMSQNPHLRFWHWYNFSAGDFGLVMIKPTNSIFWVGLSEQYNNTSSGTWSYTFYDLNLFAGLEVQFAFYFHSEQIDYWDPDVSSGWYIDDISVQYSPYSDNFTLNSGWNLISFDNVLNEAPPATIFQPLITTNNLQMVTGFQNQQGVFYNPAGLPFLNTLQHVVDGEGYWVKLQTAATFSATGIPLARTFSVDLKSGWNLIGYWPTETITPETAFASLITEDKLEMVTSFENGGTYFDPEGLPYLNTLTEIKNGFGYWVKVNANVDDFSYPVAEWLCGDTLSDVRDDKSYETIKIGTQCWMKENLNIGTKIAGANNQVNNGIIEKYCYDNSEANCELFGGLYQWNEMMQYSTTPGIQGICPTGWHLPTETEISELQNYLGGSSVAGGKMKIPGTSVWDSPNTGATNLSGFSALPTGSRYTDGTFTGLNMNCYFFSSTQIDASNAKAIRLYYDSEQGNQISGGKTYGDPVRCIKDN